MLPAPGSTPGDSMLNMPPPSPATATGQNPGTPLGQLVPPIPTHQLPPEVLQGILGACEQMSGMLDAFAQATPDLAPDWAAVKNALLSASSKVLQAGAAPTAPTSPGPNFPGGGIDRGGMPSASASG